MLQLRQDDTFYDIGSGTTTSVLQMALNTMCRVSIFFTDDLMQAVVKKLHDLRCVVVIKKLFERHTSGDLSKMQLNLEK